VKRCWLSVGIVVCCVAARADQAGDFSRYVKSLDAEAPESRCQAAAELRLLMPRATMAERGAMFREFRKFRDGADVVQLFGKSAEPFFQQLFGYEDRMPALKQLLKQRRDIDQAVGAWFRCGYKTIDSEGTLSLAEDLHVYDEFVPQLPRDLRDYVRFMVKEDQRIAEDAGILITWEQLRARIGRWEEFAQLHPNLPETASEVQAEVERLTDWLLCGIDNSRVLDGPGSVDRRALGAWKRYARLNAASAARQKVREVLPFIDAQGKVGDVGKLEVLGCRWGKRD
jgi:hypothetical protein